MIGHPGSTDSTCDGWRRAAPVDPFRETRSVSIRYYRQPGCPLARCVSAQRRPVGKPISFLGWCPAGGLRSRTATLRPASWPRPMRSTGDRTGTSTPQVTQHGFGRAPSPGSSRLRTASVGSHISASVPCRDCSVATLAGRTDATRSHRVAHGATGGPMPAPSVRGAPAGLTRQLPHISQ